MVNFAKLKEESKKNRQAEGQAFVVLGASGSGKSSLLGSFGCPTLILYTSDESHSTQSSGIHNGDITNVCLDRGDNGEPLSADDTLAKLIDILQSEDIPEHFGAVCLDSLSSIDLIIKRSGWFDKFIMGSNGKKNDFKSSEAVITKIQELFTATQGFRQKGVNFMCTLAAHIKSMDSDGNGEVVTPVLSSYGCADQIPRLASGVLFLGKVEIDGERKRALLFNTTISKNSKDLKGGVTKMLSFSPRLAGVRDEELPEALPADMSKVLKLIKELKE
jgi:energy-coupling factor transporter ATP-binding protein EcfA2